MATGRLGEGNTSIQPTIVDAKGDIIAATAADTVSRLAVGANDTVLTADSSTATGLKWAAAASSSGPACLVERSSSQSISQNTATKIQFNSEVFDTDNCFDSTTNYRFTPTKAGKYQVNTTLRTTGSNTWYAQLSIYKNGSAVQNLSINPSAGNGWTVSVPYLIDMNGSSDYIEMFGYSGATDANFTAGSSFSAVWIRS